MKELLRQRLMDAGAVAIGFAVAGEIDARSAKIYKNWIEAGHNGEMKYLERHLPLRKHTDNVLPGAKTVISLAFSFAPDASDKDVPGVACYAYGDDYHIVLREKLSPVISGFKATYGGKWRLCIDSAPVAERYWAQKSGVASPGLNAMMLVKGCGSYTFLAEILTTHSIEPDKPTGNLCTGCKACINACPAKALFGDGTMDARKCINYLTIEKKGDFSESEKSFLKSVKSPLFGCHRCIQVCPLNQDMKFPAMPEFKVNNITACISAHEISLMTESDFESRFKRSPLLYAGLETLKRNALISEDKS